MRAITALSIASDAIRAAVIADPYTDSPTIKHFQALPPVSYTHLTLPTIYSV